MSKPPTIYRHLCYGRDEEEKYKDIAVIDYWWGLRELAASFEVDQFLTISGTAPSRDQQKEIAYVQILHYTVYVKSAGAFYQIEQMEQLLDPAFIDSASFELRMFKTKEAFDALHTDLYQAVCALANQLLTLLNRKGYKQLEKYDHRKRVAATTSELKHWLKMNSHPDSSLLRSLLFDCDKQLDIRHHSTHYGAVPIVVDAQKCNIYIQREFHIGEILTRFDLDLYKDKGGPLVTILESSKARATRLCKAVDKIYHYMYASDTFEDYMDDRGLKLKDSYKPYWQGGGNPGLIED